MSYGYIHMYMRVIFPLKGSYALNNFVCFVKYHEL